MEFRFEIAEVETQVGRLRKLAFKTNNDHAGGNYNRRRACGRNISSEWSSNEEDQ